LDHTDIRQVVANQNIAVTPTHITFTAFMLDDIGRRIWAAGGFAKTSVTVPNTVDPATYGIIA
jgi:hypothetical protein